MDNEPDQGALFEIEGPDDDSCVWLVSGKGADAVVVNLGPRDAVAEKLAHWLCEIDFSERPCA
ncbi:MAG TPA: hypothetical protein VF631_05200 [Allosphingosinicella sp.]|jgi:hypothetical protein|uniref:hypothetical protein n=1 Tax=Allosphingosinicella sp. TaxID=2823234 RepID=UPI002F2AD803